MSEPASGQQKPPRKARGRSPSYPAIDLATAIDKAKALHDQERQIPASVETIVKHWGYRSFNGPASLSLAALKKYGLVEDQGTGAERVAKVSDLAVDILANPDADERQRAVERAALNPAIHRELWEKYGPNLPSDANLRWELTRQRGFTETGADEFLPVYRNTLAYAGLDKAGTLQPQSVEQEDERPDEDNELRPRPGPRRQRQRSGGMSESGVLTIPVPVAGRSPITVELATPITEQAFDQFIAVLQAMKPGLLAMRPEDADTAQEDAD